MPEDHSRATLNGKGRAPMAKGAKTQAATRKRAPVRRMPRKAKPRSRGLEPKECRLQAPPDQLTQVLSRVEKEEGVVVGAYSDPLSGQPLALAILPIDRIEPTPFQRDLSQ